MAEHEDSVSIRKVLKRYGACPEALEWAADKDSVRKLWTDCPEPDWLLRALKALDYRNDAKLRLFAATCARRNARLFPNEKCIRVVKVAEAAAGGHANESELREALNEGTSALTEVTRLPAWSTARAAAMRCARDSVRVDPWEAAQHASRNGLRASPCIVKEAQWQLNELRRILDPDLPLLIQQARKLLAGRTKQNSSGRSDDSHREPGQSPNGTVRQHFEIAGQCIGAIRSACFQLISLSALEGQYKRLADNLDGLSIAGISAIDTGRAAMNDDSEVAGVVALLLAEAESDQTGASEQAVVLLRHESPEIRQVAWWGLRLASSRHVESHLRALVGKTKWDIASAAALDILAFHRLPVQAELGEPPDEQGDEIAWLLVEAGGRMRGAWKATHLKQFLGHPSPRVREAALRASARCGLPELLTLCREATLSAAPLEAIEFLGVVGSPEDLSHLQRAVSSPATARAALTGLGRLGLPAAVPVLLEFLSHPELTDSAAAAIERITGQEAPRGDPPEPPPGMTEDELDLWEPEPPVDVPRARDWWEANAGRFDPTKRYQAALCVSDDPLGPVFDKLPLAIRYDVYLRQRALVLGTPDWELETWISKQKNPGG